MVQRWLAVDNIAPYLTDSRFQHRTFRSRDVGVTAEPTSLTHFTFQCYDTAFARVGGSVDEEVSLFCYFCLIQFVQLIAVTEVS